MARQLAIHGGTPEFPDGPPSWPPADDDVRCTLEAAIADGTWGRYHAAHTDRLAAALAEFHPVEFVTLCCSGTFAVELALRGLAVGPGDEVILAGYDFGGNFRGIEATGARPVLVDIDPDTWAIDPAILEEAVGRATKAILVSHLHGAAAPMRAITGFARAKGLAVVEDACQAPGALVEGRIAGTWGDVGVLSFGGSKLLTAGRGGAILTTSAAIHQRAKIFCERGNNAFALSQLQAAVLLPQLRRLEERNERRRAAVERLAVRLRPLSAVAIPVRRLRDTQLAYYKLGLQYAAESLHGVPRDEFARAMQAEGVALEAGFRGFVERSMRRCRKVGSLEQSRAAVEGTLVLHHPVLLEPPPVIDRLAGAFEKVITAIATPTGGVNPPAR